MANIRTLQKSFAGGEISPEMYGRIDDTKYQAGLALCRNFIAKPQGPVENRAGFAFVRAVKDSTKKTRLIPFTYSTTQTMVIEMGAGYFRFHTLGATLTYSTPSAWGTGAAYVVGDLVAEAGTNYYCVTAHTAGTFATDLAAGKWYAMPASIYEIPNPYAEADLFDIHYVQSADVLTLVHPNYAPKELRRYGATNWQLATISFAAPIAAPATVTATASGGSGYSYSYVATAIAADEISESAASSAGTCSGNLLTSGNTNTISWTSVSGASRYNVYKLQGGIYGYIGQTTGTSIIDDNIAPDLSVVPPTYETVFNTTNKYPGAVSYYEQRRWFAGTTDSPQNVWATRSGTESTMSYSLPIRDDDRISFRVAAREANTIRHIVPLSQLLLMTSAAEWRVTSINSDAVTPISISVRPQSYVGASNVQPAIVNTNLIYGAARGGHVRECAYNWQANGFVTGDLSLRAAHLFDNYTITDMAFSKAPYPLLWFISDSGKLLGLTYIPEQQVGAWHQHDTADGRDVFESCTVVAENKEDVLYVVVKRYINSAWVRYIERIATRLYSDQEDAFFVDSGLTYDGTNTGSVTMTVTGGTTWGPGEVLTITASSTKFVYPGTTDVGDAIVLTDTAGIEYTLLILSTTSGTVATARVDKIIPAALRGVATTSWGFARNTIAGLTHLEGETVNVLADGAVHPREVVASGSITLDVPAVVVQVGLPIVADLQTLPLAMQIDSGFGQGRMKNVNKAWLRVYQSSGIWIGPDDTHLTEAKQRTTELYGDPPALRSEEIPILLTPSWADSGHVFVRQSDPLPLTVAALVLEVSVGG